MNENIKNKSNLQKIIDEIVEERLDKMWCIDHTIVQWVREEVEKELLWNSNNS